MNSKTKFLFFFLHVSFLFTASLKAESGIELSKGFWTGSRNVVISENSVLFGSADGNLYRLDPKNGSVHWKYKLNDTILSAPLLEGRNIYLGGKSGSPVSGNGKLFFLDRSGVLLAVNPHDGR